MHVIPTKLLTRTFRLPGTLVPGRKPGELLHAMLLRRYTLKECVIYFSFAVYSFVCFLLFFGLVQPWINGDTYTRLGADSDRYWSAAWLLADPAAAQTAALISFHGNLLGPVLLAYVLKYQLLVLAFNYLLLGIALWVAARIQGVRIHILLLLLMLNAETAISLITLNKEIFALLSAAFAAKYLLTESHPRIFLALCLVSSLVTRWEQAALVLLVAFLTRRGSFLFKRPRLAVASVLVAITIAYPLLARYQGYYLLAFTQYTEGANTIVKLNHLQAAFGFPIALLPKMAMNILGELIRPNYYFGPFWEIGFEDLHSQIVLPLFSMALVGMFLVAYRRGLLTIQRPVFFLIAIYLIGTAVTPFIQPRYEYFVYVLLCIEVARKEEASANIEEGSLRRTRPRPSLVAG